jgi:hypothetical protein
MGCTAAETIGAARNEVPPRLEYEHHAAKRRVARDSRCYEAKGSGSDWRGQMAEHSEHVCHNERKWRMNRGTLFAQRINLGIVVAACCLVICGCLKYDVPITCKATRKVDARLLGNWTSKDGKDKMKVVKLDDSNYIVAIDGELYRAYHSDVAGTPLLSVQILESNKPQYAYFTWKLPDDGTLCLRIVSDKVVPIDTKDSASVQKLLKRNLRNPALFEDEIQMAKDK